jgi:Uma2 family endonuclease
MVMDSTHVVSQYELERGKPVPRLKHGIVQANLVALLYRYVKQFDIISELDINVNGKSYTPDVCVYPKFPRDWTAEEEPIAAAPLIAIEITSQSQSLDALIQKADVYLRAGTPTVWLVIPSLQTIFVLLPTTKPIAYTHGLLKDDATGIEISVDDVFR